MDEDDGDRRRARAHAPGHFNPLSVDAQQPRSVARWRKAERMRLRDERASLEVRERQRISRELTEHLRAFLDGRIGTGAGCVLSAYWPIKGEPNLRPLLTYLHERGVQVALPLVERKAAPLVFRRWTPGTRMVRGYWNIPVPPPEADIVRPEIVFAPVLGWDGAGYRLGYGGGYFDRTLAALSPRPFSIGIGLEAARLATIHPQPHDISLDLIVTEAGIRFRREWS